MSDMSNTPHQKASVYELRRSVSFALHLIGVAIYRVYRVRIVSSCVDVCMGERKNDTNQYIIHRLILLT